MNELRTQPYPPSEASSTSTAWPNLDKSTEQVPCRILSNAPSSSTPPICIQPKRPPCARHAPTHKRPCPASPGECICTDAKINHGFQGHIKFSEAMIVIERHEHGWRWGAICKRGDVLVWVRLQNMRMAQIPYREAIGQMEKFGNSDHGLARKGQGAIHGISFPL